MTLTQILPSLRRSIPDPLVRDHWPEYTVASPADVTVAGLSMTTLVQWSGTPCVHTAAAVIPGTNGRPSETQLASVVVARVVAVERQEGRLAVWIDAELSTRALIDDARMIGRASTAHTSAAVIFGPTPHSPVRNSTSLPRDLEVGDLVAIPCVGVTRLRDVTRGRDQSPHSAPADDDGAPEFRCAK